MAPGVTSGRVEPKDHPKLSHWVHPVFSSPWRGGRPPHGLRIRVARGTRLRRGCQPASPRGLTGPAGRSAPRGLDALRKISTVSQVLPSTKDTPAGLQRRGFGPKAPPRQPRTPQAITSMGGTLRRSESAQAQHVQAGQRGRRRTHQRLEHPTAMSLLPLARTSKFFCYKSRDQHPSW
jgi:hypothetical protein